MAVKTLLHVVVVLQVLVFMHWTFIISCLMADICSYVRLQQLHVEHSVTFSAKRHVIVFAIDFSDIWLHDTLSISRDLLLAIEILIASDVLLNAMQTDRTKLFCPSHCWIKTYNKQTRWQDSLFLKYFVCHKELMQILVLYLLLTHNAASLRN